ncbi:MAG: hypothetical protein QOI55_329 [Actinomycetota bacterium]|nr:hypothetical protein [Actinomycetota bacterium]
MGVATRQFASPANCSASSGWHQTFPVSDFNGPTASRAWRRRLLVTAVVVAWLVSGCISPGTDLTPGAWSWFEGPRVILTANGCELLAGTSGHNSNGSFVGVGSWRLGPRVRETATLDAGQLYADDHNTPGLLELPGGRQGDPSRCSRFGAARGRQRLSSSPRREALSRRGGGRRGSSPGPSGRPG